MCRLGPLHGPVVTLVVINLFAYLLRKEKPHSDYMQIINEIY